MRTEKWITVVLAGGLAVSAANAQDYGDNRDVDAPSTVRDDSVLTASIVGFAGGQWNVVNADGHAEVIKSSWDNPMFVDIGRVQTDNDSSDVVQAAWSEVSLPQERLIEVTFRTENGGQFMPLNAELGGDDVMAYSFEIGGNGDGVDFRHWVSAVRWEELTISYSSDGGQTVFSDPTIVDPINGADWDGTDDLHLGLAFPGDGVNWIRATYTIDVVPAPATATLLIGAGALAARRRRN